MTTNHTCPDCQAPLHKIQILDRIGGAARSSGLVFLADGDSMKLSWKGKVSNRLGKVHGYMCSDCHRVLFYADLD